MKANKPGMIPRLQQMEAEQVDTLVRWLAEEKLTYGQARIRLKSEFGVETSCSALSAFWQQVVAPRQWAKLVTAERAKTFVGESRLILEIQVRAEADNTLRITVSGPSADKAN
jgi:hypothetical protein